MEAGMRRAGDSCADALMTGKAQQFPAQAPTPSTSRFQIPSGKPVHFAVAAHTRNAVPAPAPVQLQLAPTWLEA